jgi:type VI secretion system protein ImpC
MAKQATSGQSTREPAAGAEKEAPDPVEAMLSAHEQKLHDVTEEMQPQIDEIFGPWQPEASKASVEAASRAVLAGQLSGDALQRLDKEGLNALVAKRKAVLEKRLSAGLNKILHNEKFKKIEAAWRGLEFLIQQSKAGEKVKIQLLCAGKGDLAADMKTAGKSENGFRKTRLYRKFYREKLGMEGEEPITAVVCGHAFSGDKNDLDLLRSLSKIAQHAHLPWIAPASPTFFNCDSFADFNTDLDWVTEFRNNRPDWNAFRATEESRYAALCLPSIVLRSQYRNQAVGDHFKYTETITSAKDYLWGGSAHALGGRIGAAFADFGWPARICGKHSGGRVDDLCLVSRPNSPAKMAAEVQIDMELETPLSDLGFVPLVHRFGNTYGIFFLPASAHKPKTTKNALADETDYLTSRFPHLMVACRFAQYLKVILRDAIGSSKEPDEIQQDLEDWLTKYKYGGTGKATPREKAEKPLKDFSVAVKKLGKGRYEANITVTPHYIIEMIGVSIQIVAEPEPKAT